MNYIRCCTPTCGIDL